MFKQRNAGKDGEPVREQDQDDGLPNGYPDEEPEADEAFPTTEAPTAASPKASASPKATPGPKAASSPGSVKRKETTVDRSSLVNKVIEGLRGDAFLIARDLGSDTLIKPGGLELLVQTIRTHVFPRGQ